jgi:hypothetical protein
LAKGRAIVIDRRLLVFAGLHVVAHFGVTTGHRDLLICSDLAVAADDDTVGGGRRSGLGVRAVGLELSFDALLADLDAELLQVVTDQEDDEDDRARDDQGDLYGVAHIGFT